MLVEVARFTTLSEAHVAAGALRATGVPAEVFDDGLGGVNWMMQQAVGGFRLVTPEQDAPEARAMISQMRNTPAPPDKTDVVAEAPKPKGLRRLIAVLGLLLFGGAV